MKKYMNPEVELINLNTNDVIATSDPVLGSNPMTNGNNIGVGARFYDEYDEEEEW